MNDNLDFTKKELGGLEGVETLNSGTAEDQFVQECIELCRYWLDKQAGRDLPSETQALLLIYDEAPRVSIEASAFNRSVRVRKKSGTLNQGIVFCNQNFSIMMKVEDMLSVDLAYAFVEEKLSASTTFVIGKLGQKTLQIHRSGQELEDWLNEPDELVIKTEAVTVTPDSIEEELSIFHHNYLSTEYATASRNMWRLSPQTKKYVLTEQPEQHIQSFLLIHLKANYSKTGVFVNEEIKNQGGRVDICIERESFPGSKKK